MRPLRSIVFTLLTLAAAPAASAGGWYVEALVGANFPDDVDFGIDAGAIETSLDDGYLWGVGFGYQFKHVRLNAELDTSREADVDVHSLDGAEQAGSRGEVQSEAGMGNVLFDFNKDKRISPYVGAGIGLAEIELNNLGTDGIPTIVDAEDTVFAHRRRRALGRRLQLALLRNGGGRLRHHAGRRRTADTGRLLGVQRHGWVPLQVLNGWPGQRSLDVTVSNARATSETDSCGTGSAFRLGRRRASPASGTIDSQRLGERSIPAVPTLLPTPSMIGFAQFTSGTGK
jgi:hypothetical protein